VATKYTTPDGLSPTHVESFEYEQGVFILQATFRMPMGAMLRLDFYDFSDLVESTSMSADSFDSMPELFSPAFPQSIQQFEYATHNEKDIFRWSLRTEECSWEWISEFPIEASKGMIAEAEKRRIDRDRKYKFGRAIRKLLGRLVSGSRELPAGVDSPLNEANLFLNLGIAAQESKNFKLAEKHYRRSLKLFDRHKDQLTWAKGHHQMGNVNFERGDYDSARRWHLRALELARKNKFQQLEASALYWLGTIGLHSKEDDFGFGHYQQSAEAARSSKGANDMANALFGMGTARTRTGGFEEAISHFKAALRAEQALPGNTVRQLQCLSSIVNCYILARDLGQATLFAKQAEEIAREKSSVEAVKQVKDMFSTIQEARNGNLANLM
jgi:tetratricopeptide (TPR) repeat protein